MSGNAKDRLIKLLGQLPDDATLDDIADRIAYVLGIERGLEDAAAGRLTTTEDLLIEIRQWKRTLAAREER